MEFITGLFAGILLWPAVSMVLAACILFGILAEHNDAHGWAVTFALGAFGAGYMLVPGIGIGTIAAYAAIYLAIGFAWSVYRYWRWLGVKVATINQTQYQDTEWGIREKESDIKKLHFTQNLNKLTAWIIVWPFSMLENVVGDVIDIIKSLITDVFKQLFQGIYNSATKDLK